MFIKEIVEWLSQYKENDQIVLVSDKHCPDVFFIGARTKEPCGPGNFVILYNPTFGHSPYEVEFPDTIIDQIKDRKRRGREENKLCDVCKKKEMDSTIVVN